MIHTVTPYDIKLVFVQNITFVLRKIGKNCCHQSCTFDSNLVQYAPNRLSAGALPQTPPVFMGPTSEEWGEKGKERKGRGRKEKGWEGNEGEGRE